MPDINTVSVAQILNSLDYVEFWGKKSAIISKLIVLDEMNTEDEAIFWCSDLHIEKLEKMQCGTVICSPLAQQFCLNEKCNYIFVSNPRQAFKTFLDVFCAPKPTLGYVAASAKISPGVRIPASSFIQDNVVIEEGCEIGRNVIVGHNTVIRSNTRIGNYVEIGCNTTIGGGGFGYERNQLGDWKKIIHLGGVSIADHVEIGNNSCIDKGVIGDTVIGENVKIDNLVHIAHNVKIGRNCCIVAHAMVGGSSSIEEDSWVAPHVSIRDGLVLGAKSFVGLGAVVVKGTTQGEVVVGNPAKPIRS